MIRVNLLRQKKAPKKPFWTRPKIQLQWAPGVFFVVASIGIGSWYWQLTQEQVQRKEALDRLKQQTVQLKVGENQFEQLRKEEQLLKERIALIEQLKTNQKGPVQLMNAVIAGMPDEPRLYLSSLVQRESLVEIEGRAVDVPAIADLIARLSGQRPFKSVDLDFWEEHKGDLLKFELTCEIGS